MPSSSRPRPPAPLGAALRAALLAVSAAAGLPPPAAQAQVAPAREAAHHFDIPAAPLSTALTRVVAQAGARLSVDAALTAGRNAPPLQGTMSLRDALDRLLAGSGLVAGIEGSQVIVRPAPRSEAAPGAERMLPPVTVLGAREPNMPRSNVPSSISQVRQPAIQRDLAVGATIEDLLARNVPGVHPSNVGSRTIRGRTAQVFVNGAPMNEQLRFGSGSDLNTLSPDHFESIEVSRGANAAYGFGSPGGIIALATPQARTETLSLQTRLRTSFNTGDPGGSLQSTAYQSASQIVGPFDFHVAFSALRDGTSRTPDGEVANFFTSPGLFKTGDEKIVNVDTNLGYDLGSAGRVRLIATGQHIDYVRYYGFEGGVYRQTHVTTTPVPDAGLSYRRAHTVNLSYENELGSSALKLEAFGSRVYSSRRELFDEWFKEKNAYAGLRSSITTPLPALASGAVLSYGLDAIRNEMTDPLYSSATGALTGRFAPPARLDMWAPYAQMRWPLGATRFSAGVRHERYGGRVDSTGRGSVTVDDDGPGGKIRDFGITLLNAGLLRALGERTDLHATYTQGAEISEVRRAGFRVDRADRIDPQAARSHQIELGLRRKGDALSGGITAFYTRSRLMSATDCSNPDLPCTPLREPRRIWGLELAGEWKMNAQWRAAGTLTWHDGRRRAEGAGEWTRLSSIDVAPVHGSLVLTHLPRAGWRNELIVDARGGRGRIGDGWPYGPVEAVTLLHATTSIALGPGTLTLGVHNLLDKTYYAIQAEAYQGGWVWLPEQGRRVSLGYTLKW
jgi:iron complex outermembrane recepter protein